jgi:hypothetical protein
VCEEFRSPGVFLLLINHSSYLSTLRVYCMTLTRNICLGLKDSKNVCAQCHKAEHIP